jgi:HD-GYP domain-containing protein (c-di-GMP phosphodiesterase class II)
LEIAGQLHDLGKLSVPESILHKSGKLSNKELNIIKQHTYHTYELIDRLQTMDKVRDWAAFHHEKLDGSGYPFHKRGQELDLGARIMAVADIFTALSEDRSYRKRMNRNQILCILWEQVKNNWIDGDVVRMLEKHYDAVAV